MIVLIDGRSGAGKTTFAEVLGARLGAPVVHLEDFYPGWWGLEPASRMVSRDVLRKEHPGWWCWDWGAGLKGEWVPLDLGVSGHLVIEGCGAISNESISSARALGLGPVVTVDIDADAQVRKDRALARDPEFAPWWDMWADQELAHRAGMPRPDIRLSGGVPDVEALINEIYEKGQQMEGSIIRIAAVVIRNAAGEILSVRKRDTSAFMLPGGKLEPGETGLGAAVREIAEELHLTLAPGDLDCVGTMRAPAANEPGFEVVCDVFEWGGRLEEVDVFEEIVEARWFAVTSTAEELAPLSRDVVFPALANRG